jgi:hypothetical protein
MSHYPPFAHCQWPRYCCWHVKPIVLAAQNADSCPVPVTDSDPRCAGNPTWKRFLCFASCVFLRWTTSVSDLLPTISPWLLALSVHSFIYSACGSRISFSSICSLLGQGSSVCGAGGIPPNALQPTEAYCANPAFWFPRSSPEAVHFRRRKRSLSEKGGSMGEKYCTRFSLTIATSTSL